MRSSVSTTLFCHFGGEPLTRYQFNAMLRRALNFAHVHDDHISSHSFRIGAASTAAQSSVSIDDIRAMGRWRSNAVLRYIRPIPVSILNDMSLPDS